MVWSRQEESVGGKCVFELHKKAAGIEAVRSYETVRMRIEGGLWIEGMVKAISGS